MKTKSLMIAVAGVLLMAGSSLAMMGGGMGGGGGGRHMTGYTGGTGYGMGGAGGMLGGMMGNTIAQGYLDILTPVEAPTDAAAAVDAFIANTNSDLAISEMWEYETAFKAELSDTTGARAFDLMLDKFTGAVIPEMGMSLMMNASFGRGLYRMPKFGKRLILPPEQATTIAQTFIDNNGLGYTLGAPETYPGFYKFHTTDEFGGFGMDIMVNGYRGGVWMNTLLGVPIAGPLAPPF